MQQVVHVERLFPERKLAFVEPCEQEQIVGERSAACSSSALRGRSRARSTSVRTSASGARSSWLASATKLRSRFTARSIRVSISFSVAPSRAISSFALGTGSRSDRCCSVITAARVRMRSTGRSAAPATR
jgi:hypothetical protein